MSKYDKWVAAYGNAMSITDHRVETYSKDITLRYPIYMPFSGDKIRLTFDNCCGTEPVTITSCVIAKAVKSEGTSAASDISTNTCVTFDGNENVTIGAGQKIVSDEIDFDVIADEFMNVSFYLSDYTLMRSSVVAMGPLSKGFYSVGDATRSECLDLDMTRKTDVFYFLSDIDVRTESNNRAVICYGDSITAQDWPDYLMLGLKEMGIRNISIIRKAASGTRILRQYDNITYESYGLKATNRVPREWQVAGADTIIIQQGINDIIHPVGIEVNPFRPMSDLPTANELIDGIRWYVSEARKAGFKVYLGTLLPILGWRTYEDFREALKNEFNEWMRNTDISDGCIDFDEALRDEYDGRSFAAINDSGDHLHPSKNGYKKMAETVLLKIFS